MHYPIETILAALQKNWSSSTSLLKSGWSQDNPTRGQGVASCLVIQQLLGGTLKRFKVTYKDKAESHYTNVLSNGIVVDSTAAQYPPLTKMVEAQTNLEGNRSIKAKLLSDPGTKRRYELLLGKVKTTLKGRKFTLPKL